MNAVISCVRCGRADAPALTKPPMRSALGTEIAARVCLDCWLEWERAEVMVINELRLNFMDPGATRVLESHLRQFLSLDPPVEAR
jgi:Fe-S cluster biosynthesis and repair protein YggX